MTLVQQKLGKSTIGGPEVLFFQCSFSTVGLVVLVARAQSMVSVIALKLLCWICPGVVSSDIKYHTPAILQMLVKKIEKCQNSHISKG